MNIAMGLIIFSFVNVFLFVIFAGIYNALRGVNEKWSAIMLICALVSTIFHIIGLYGGIILALPPI